ncbi:MAG: ribonuclease III [Clostridia bacterium]|jgi:ribonuclease-3 family protein|nr:ribonuclease III [Clostridia bacterium]
MEKVNLEKLLQTNLLPLAFIGDGVHTLFVREHCLRNGALKLENYHIEASSYCKASSQAAALEGIMPILNEEELNIVRRARNAKPKHHAKNASSGDYSHATAFEALIGFLYLKEDKARLEEILLLSLNSNQKKS